MAKIKTNLHKDISDFLAVFQLDPAVKEKVVENISGLSAEEQRKVLDIIVRKMRDLNLAQREFLNDVKKMQKQTLQARSAAEDETAEADVENSLKNL